MTSELHLLYSFELNDFLHKTKGEVFLNQCLGDFKIQVGWLKKKRKKKPGLPHPNTAFPI